MPQFQTEYGYFSDDGRKYIITRPDTPMPWVNVISNQNYGLVLPQAGGGYSWLTHAGFNRITRWEQDLIRDEWGNFFTCAARKAVSSGCRQGNLLAENWTNTVSVMGEAIR